MLHSGSKFMLTQGQSESYQSLKWEEPIIANEKSMIKSLNGRLNALRRISYKASFKTRLMVGNACFLSIISYMVAIWGGTEKYVIRAVQVMQNKAARCITKLGWFTPTSTLLLQCNWLSINQIIFLHTILQVWKVRTLQTPAYLHHKFVLKIQEAQLREIYWCLMWKVPWPGNRSWYEQPPPGT